MHKQRQVLTLGSCYLIDGSFGWQHPKVLAPGLVVQSWSFFVSYQYNIFESQKQ